MKLTSVQFSRFELPLARPLTTSDSEDSFRRGLLVEVVTSGGERGWGEISPLPGLSKETLDETTDQARSVAFRLRGADIPENLEELSGGFEDWFGDLNLAPSIRFGLESAILAALSGGVQAGLASFLCDRPLGFVSVNALLTGPPRETIRRARELQRVGYRSFKLKVGRNSREDDASMARLLRETLGDDAEIRLDANRAWNANEARSFASDVADCSIAYCEEPFSDPADLSRSLSGDEFPIAQALDETLLEIEPRDIKTYERARAAVIKPTALGLERSMRFARAAIAAGMAPVVSSCFESGVGLTTLLQLAACIHEEGSAAGLDTASWLDADLLEAGPQVVDGAVEIAALPDVATALRRNMLEPIADA